MPELRLAQTPSGGQLGALRHSHIDRRGAKHTAMNAAEASLRKPSLNIDEYDAAGGKVISWGFVPEGPLATGDVMLAQSLHWSY